MTTLSLVRQKLVPGKMKEHVFWETLWVILYERNRSRDRKDFWKRLEFMANEAIIASSNPGTDTKNRYHTRFLSPQQQQHMVHHQQRQQQVEIKKLRDKLKTAWDCVSRLTVETANNATEKERTEGLVRKLWSRVREMERERNNNNNNNKQQPSSPQQQRHTGTWQMTKDSTEFLALPEDAKESLRLEKQKRLARVREEMRFILDSDAVEDSHGEWTCCHRTDYHGDNCVGCRAVN